MAEVDRKLEGLDAGGDMDHDENITETGKERGGQSGRQDRREMKRQEGKRQERRGGGKRGRLKGGRQLKRSELCGFKAAIGETRTLSEGRTDDSLRNAALFQAMSDVAAIANSAASHKPREVSRANVRPVPDVACRSSGHEALTSPVIFVVVHALTKEQVAENIQLVLDEGATGVFLVNHDFDYPEMLPIVRHVRGQFPSLFLGVNFHTLNGADAFPILGRLSREGIKIDAYWADNACIEHERAGQPQATAISQVRQTSGWDGLYFGGTAFKNPKNHVKLCKPVPPEFLKDVASYACPYMDVVTTSGAESGVAPDMDKVLQMRAGCGETPLCLGSGVSADNVKSFVDNVDCFFVATSIQVKAPARADCALIVCGCRRTTIILTGKNSVSYCRL
eukprot:748043-Hanusia_phi.AAC.6